MDQFLQQTINGIQQGSIYALIALGYTMVYGVLGLINFAHGDVFMIGSFVGFYAARAMRLSEKATFGEAMLALVPVLLITMVVCAALGLLIERLAYRPLRKSTTFLVPMACIGPLLYGALVLRQFGTVPPLTAFITPWKVLLILTAIFATIGFVVDRFVRPAPAGASRLTALITAIGVSLLLANGAQLLFGAEPKFYPSVTPQGVASTVKLGNVTMAKDQMVLVGAAIVLMGILWYIVNRTKVGQAMRAVQHDTQAAALMGINVDGVIAFTFGLGAALAGAAGMLFGAFTYAQVFPLLGVQMGLKAFVAAVVGGIGSIPGAVVGGLLMGISESFVKGAPKVMLPGGIPFEPSRFTDAVAFVLLIVILLLRPAGLLGKFAPEKV